MTQLSADPITKHPSETLRIDVDFTLYGLASSELLTGTPVVTVTGLTSASPVVNSATFVNRKGGTVAIGKGVQFTLAGGTAGNEYDVTVSCGTDGNPAQTLVGTFTVLVSSE